jgi:hypothetical protein
MNIQDSRVLIKRCTTSGVVPTIPASDDHTDTTWLPTDIYKGEFFINLADSLIWTRTDAGIFQFGQTVAGDVYLFGDSVTNGSVRLHWNSGTSEIEMQKRVAGVWTNGSTFSF